jgi:hypothetical protein
MTCPACNNEHPDPDPDEVQGCFHCGWPVGLPSEERGLDFIPKGRYADVLQDLVDDYEPGVSDDPDGEDLVSKLRRLDSEPDKLLERAGYQVGNVGISVTSRGAWKQKHRHVTDQPLFEFLVLDAVECHLYFWQVFHGYETPEAFLDAVLEDGEHGSSETNIAETYQWLVDDVDAPTELTDRQSGLAQFGTTVP